MPPQYWLYGLAPLNHLYTLARISCWPPEDGSIFVANHVGVNFTWAFNVFLIKIVLWVHELVITEKDLSPLFSYFPFTPYLSLHACLTYRCMQGVSDRADISNKAGRLQNCEHRFRCLTVYQVWRTMLSSSHLVETRNILQSIKFVDIYSFVSPTFW